jgi:hypothetical protein
MEGAVSRLFPSSGQAMPSGSGDPAEHFLHVFS